MENYILIHFRLKREKLWQLWILRGSGFGSGGRLFVRVDTPPADDKEEG